VCRARRALARQGRGGESVQAAREAIDKPAGAQDSGTVMRTHAHPPGHLVVRPASVADLPRPRPAGPEAVLLQLQQSVGNAAVANLVARSTAPTAQPPSVLGRASGGLLQRCPECGGTCGCEEEEEELRAGEDEEHAKLGLELKSVLHRRSLRALPHTASGMRGGRQLQRQVDERSARDQQPLPTRGPDVRTALQGRYPALLTALTKDQLDHWQRVVDYYTIEREVGRRRGALGDEFAYYGTLATQHPDYIKKLRRLNAAVPEKPSEQLSVNVRSLLSDDVKDEPEWDVKAELAFRQWAVERITKEPLQLTLRPDPEEALAQHPMPGIVNKTKGFITANDLRNEYRAEYDAKVVNRPEMVKLRQALAETQEVFDEVVPQHRERSDINAKRIGWGMVRHVSEAIGKGDTDYPTIHIWDKPKALLGQAGPLLAERKFEMAVPVIAMAEQATAECAQRFMSYEERVMTGAGTAVKWLGRMKTAGSIAAGIASGGLGLTGSALVAGGYTLAQEGAGRLSEMHYGQRKHFGVASLIEEAGVSAVMTVLGGALQSRFQAAFKARLDKIPGLAGTKFNELTSSALASGTSSVYNTAAELAIKAVVDGKALPKDANELADMIIDNAIDNVLQDVALSGVNKRVATEYEAWKSGAAKPAVTVPGEAPTEHGEPRPGGKPGEETAPKRLPEEAVRSLLKEGGGWDRLHAELESGTGLGANMAPAERQALIDRFKAQRTNLAREVSTVFSGEIVTTGTQLEVRFTGPAGPRQVQDARSYLDAKHPGWEQRTGVKLEAPPPPREAGVRATEAQESHAQMVGPTKDGSGTVKETPAGEILVCHSPCLLMERDFHIEFRLSEDLRGRLAEVKKLPRGPARAEAEIRLEADLKSAREQREKHFEGRSDTRLRELVKDPSNPTDREADAALELRYQKELGDRPISEIVMKVRRNSKWESPYAKRVLEAGRGRRGEVLEYLNVPDLAVLRDMARYDPEAAHALERRYSELNQQQLEDMAAAGDETAAAALRRPDRGPRMNRDAEARLVEGMWERRRKAIDQAERKEGEAIARNDPRGAAAGKRAGEAASSAGTLGALETDIPGLRERIVRGSPEAPRGKGAEGGERRFFKPPGDQPPQAQFHAEEQLLNALHDRIDNSRLRPDQLDGHTVRIAVDQAVCSTCASGLSGDAHAGTLLQFSQKYPGLRVEITDIRTGDLDVYQGGARIQSHRRAGQLQK
jgi:hypothetical protein